MNGPGLMRQFLSEVSSWETIAALDAFEDLKAFDTMRHRITARPFQQCCVVKMISRLHHRLKEMCQGIAVSLDVKEKRVLKGMRITPFLEERFWKLDHWPRLATGFSGSGRLAGSFRFIGPSDHVIGDPPRYRVKNRLDEFAMEPQRINSNASLVAYYGQVQEPTAIGGETPLFYQLVEIALNPVHRRAEHRKKPHSTVIFHTCAFGFFIIGHRQFALKKSDLIAMVVVPSQAGSG